MDEYLVKNDFHLKIFIYPYKKFIFFEIFEVTLKEAANAQHYAGNHLCVVFLGAVGLFKEQESGKSSERRYEKK